MRQVANRNSIQVYRKAPELYNPSLVEEYMKLYGTPMCSCCFHRSTRCVFNSYKLPICINCVLTMMCVGTCFHIEDKERIQGIINEFKRNYRRQYVSRRKVKSY